VDNKSIDLQLPNQAFGNILRGKDIERATKKLFDQSKGKERDVVTEI